MLKGKYLFYIEPVGEDGCPVDSMEEADGWGISINTKECWNKNHHLTDHYTDEEWDDLGPILEKLKFEEMQEATYTTELEYYPTKESLHDALIREGFEFNQEFVDWMGEQ